MREKIGVCWCMPSRPMNGGGTQRPIGVVNLRHLSQRGCRGHQHSRSQYSYGTSESHCELFMDGTHDFLSSDVIALLRGHEHSKKPVAPTNVHSQSRSSRRVRATGNVLCGFPFQP